MQEARERRRKMSFGTIYEALRKITDQKQFQAEVEKIFGQVFQAKIDWKRTEQGMGGDPDYEAEVQVIAFGQRDKIQLNLFYFFSRRGTLKTPALSLFEREKIFILDERVKKLFKEVSGEDPTDY